MLRKENLLTLCRGIMPHANLHLDNIPRREFAFLTWDDRMIRHQAHNDVDSILELALKRAPMALYASLSQYLDPSYRSPKGC